MGTASGTSEPLLAALVEAIQPYCGEPAQGPADRAGRPRRRAGRAAPATSRGPRSLLPQLSPGQWRRIGRDVLALHEGYTGRRGAFAHEANPIHTRLPAYQLYFLPRNWYRVRAVLEALPWAPPASPAAEPTGVPAAWLSNEAGLDTLRMLDLGCGTGAFSLAWLAWLAGRRPAGAAPLAVRLELVDQGHGLLDLALANLRAYARLALPGVTLHIELHADGVEAFLARRGQGGEQAIAGSAMALNELELLGPRRVSERAAALAAGLQARLRPGGCLLFVEPGTRKGFMNLMALRDRLLHLPVLYPCPHGLPCPMWDGRVRHWCHATVRLPGGFFFDAELRKRAALRFEMRDLQLAAFAVQALPGADAGAPFRPRVGERIVSAPLRPRLPASQAAARPARSPRGEPAPEAGPVVLCCAPDGQLHERPAPAGGPYTRGRWSPLPAAGSGP